MGSVGGFNGGHPSYRVGQFHEQISDREKIGVWARPNHWHDFKI